MALYDTYSGKPLAVMDTKYKTPIFPSSEDINQIAVYALSKGCDRAYLIYPAELAESLDVELGGIKVESLTFPLAGNLEENGRVFIARLMRGLGL